MTAHVQPQPQTTAGEDHLMRRIVAGDQDALMALYAAYGSQVYSIALRVLRNAGLAEEVTQDTFLKVWHKSVQWDPARGQLASWLLTIARFTAIDRLRKEQRQQTVTVDFVGGLSDDTGSLAGVGDPNWHDGQVLRTLLSQLPEEQAQVIELAFFQGWTHSELAELLDWPLGTVKTRMRLGLKKLRLLWLEAHQEPSG